MKIVRRLLIFFGFILFLCISCDIVVRWWWLSDSRLERYLNGDIRLTAEYLYANPQPTPTEHYFIPEPGAIVMSSDMGYLRSLCATGLDLFGSEWVINGKRVPIWMYNQHMMCTLGPPEWTCHHNCFEFGSALEKGLNLVEVRSAGILSYFTPHLPSQSIYQWAFVIEPSYPTPTSTPHPAFIPPTPTP